MDVVCGVGLDLTFVAWYDMFILQVIKHWMLPRLTFRLFLA